MIISQEVDTSKVRWDYDDCNGGADFWSTEFLGFSLTVESYSCGDTLWKIQKGDDDDYENDESILIRGKSKGCEDPEKVMNMLLQKVLTLKVIL